MKLLKKLLNIFIEIFGEKESDRMVLTINEKYSLVSLFNEHHEYEAEGIRNHLVLRYNIQNPDKIIKEAINQNILVITSTFPLWIALSVNGRNLRRQLK